MLHVNEVIQPQSGEHVQEVFRRHKIFLALPLLGATLCIALPFFFLFNLLHEGMMGAGLFILFLVIGITVALRTLFLWDVNALVVTNRRLVYISQSRLWHRSVQDISLSSIHEMSCEVQGIGQTLLGMGTLHIRASGSAQEMRIPRLAKVRQAQSLLQRNREPASHDAAPSLAQDANLRSEVHVLVDKASLVTLQTVKALLDKQAN